MTTTEENKDEKKKAIRRTKRLEARVTEKEYAKAVELAETCGLTLSDYIRKCALGQCPRRRLTDKEVEALCSLSDARGDLMRIALPSNLYRAANERNILQTLVSWNNGCVLPFLL